MAKQEKKQEVKTKWDYVKIIGTLQLGVGIILLIVGVISTFYIPGKVMDWSHNTAVTFEQQQETRGLDSETRLPTANDALTRGILGIEHLILFGLLETILVVLSLMLIMQGTVNVKE